MTGSLGTTSSINHQLDSASDSSALASCTLASAPNPDYTRNSPPLLSHCSASFCTVNSKAPGGHGGSNSRLPPPTPALSPLHQVDEFKDFPGHNHRYSLCPAAGVSIHSMCTCYTVTVPALISLPAHVLCGTATGVLASACDEEETGRVQVASHSRCAAINCSQLLHSTCHHHDYFLTCAHQSPSGNHMAALPSHATRSLGCNG
jgi:hypothetical protein